MVDESPSEEDASSVRSSALHGLSVLPDSTTHPKQRAHAALCHLWSLLADATVLEQQPVSVALGRPLRNAVQRVREVCSQNVGLFNEPYACVCLASFAYVFWHGPQSRPPLLTCADVLAAWSAITDTPGQAWAAFSFNDAEVSTVLAALSGVAKRLRQAGVLDLPAGGAAAGAAAAAVPAAPLGGSELRINDGRFGHDAHGVRMTIRLKDSCALGLSWVPFHIANAAGGAQSKFMQEAFAACRHVFLVSLTGSPVLVTGEEDPSCDMATLRQRLFGLRGEAATSIAPMALHCIYHVLRHHVEVCRVHYPATREHIEPAMAFLNHVLAFCEALEFRLCVTASTSPMPTGAAWLAEQRYVLAKAFATVVMHWNAGARRYDTDPGPLRAVWPSTTAASLMQAFTALDEDVTARRPYMITEPRCTNIALLNALIHPRAVVMFSAGDAPTPSRWGSHGGGRGAGGGDGGRGPGPGRGTGGSDSSRGAGGWDTGRGPGGRDPGRGPGGRENGRGGDSGRPHSGGATPPGHPHSASAGHGGASHFS